jgi:hypothetical protein
MEPNDLPIVCLPLNLSDQSAASLIEFLHQLIDALERHYAGQLLRLAHQHTAPPQTRQTLERGDTDPPF